MMKPALRIFFLFILTSLAVLKAQPACSQGVVDEIVLGLKSGDAGLIAKHFSSSINLSVPGYDNIYSCQQGKMILKTFFLQYIPKDFKIVHQGNTRDGSQYSIGIYTSSRGKLRSYFLLKKSEGTLKMYQLRIEDDK